MSRSRSERSPSPAPHATVPAEYPEMTFAAITLGIVQGSVMTAAFVYAGLKLGFTLGGSTIAAILGFALLRGVLGRGTIVENNINQTIASGINTSGGGIIFTLPVLYMMGVEFNPWTVGLAAVAGAFLGIAVIIPMRKQMVDFERLRFPSGTAVAAILKSPGAGREKAVLLVSGCLLSLLAVVLVKSKLVPEELPMDWLFDFPAYTQTAIWVSLMNLGAGLLAGRGGLSFAFGGCLAFWFLAPAGVAMGFAPPELSGQPLTDHVYGQWLRPTGIGMLIGGAFMGVVVAFPAMRSAFASLAGAARSGAGGTRDEMPLSAVGFGAAASVAVLFLVAWFGLKDCSVLRALAISLVGSVWIALAGVIVAQCTGLTDISPLSGLSLIAVTILMAMTGGNEVASILVGVAVCVAIAQCADMMQDLKTGFLIGGVPVRQQWVQLGVAWIGPLIAIPVLALLWHVPPVTPGAAKLAIARLDPQVAGRLVRVETRNASGVSSVTAYARPEGASEGEEPVRYRIVLATGAMEKLGEGDAGSALGTVDVKALEKEGGTRGFGPGTKLPAPQAGALQGMVEMVKSGKSDVNRYVTGAIAGALLTLLPVGGLGVMIGLAMYLPFSITLGYGVGCLVAIGLEAVKGPGWTEEKMVPFAAGLIIGEAMTELSYSCWLVFAG